MATVRADARISYVQWRWILYTYYGLTQIHLEFAKANGVDY